MGDQAFFSLLREIVFSYAAALAIALLPLAVVGCFFGYCLLRFIKAVERKWEREAEEVAIRKEAEKLNRPFTSDERRYQPRA